MLRPFGEIDWLEFIASYKDGLVFAELVDAGMIRRPEGRYTIGEVNEATIEVTANPATSRSHSKTIELPRHVTIDAGLLCYFGLYDGDGNKTGDIGFAQNEPILQNYVFDATRKLMGHFPTEVTILEDTRYFEGPEVKARLDELASDPSYAGATERQLKEQLMLERYQSGEIGVVTREEQTEKLRFVISPKKGARASGKSSYEIIKNHKGSRLFLPLLLALMKEVIVQLSGLSKMGRKGIQWFSEGPQHFNLLEYVATSGRCGIAGKNGLFVNHKIVKEQETSFVTAVGRGNEFAVRKLVPLTPRLFVMFGHYLAEGATTKAKLFRFRKERLPGLSVEFNSSEDASLEIFLRGLEHYFPNINRCISYWKVKVGSKYFAEGERLAQKLQVPTIRGGPKGQGKQRSPEIAAAYRKWALDQFPSLKGITDKFTHLELTGAGIPRVAIACTSSIAPLFFSSLVDLVFEQYSVDRFVIG